MKDDLQIIEAIRKGNRSTYLNMLYKRTLPKVKNYIKKNGGLQEDVEDIFQDAVIIFVQKVKDRTFDEQYEIDGFIYTVSRNLWINKAKTNKRSVLQNEFEEQKEDKVDQLNYLINEEKSSIVNQILKELGEACYELMQLTLIKELSLKEVALELGYANDNVAKTYNYRCKKKLMKLVEDTPSILNYFNR